VENKSWTIYNKNIMEKKFSRNCSQCKNELTYTSLKNRNQAERKQKKCKKCASSKNIEINRVKMQTMYLKFDDERNQAIIDLFNELGSNWKIFRKQAFKLFERFKKETKQTVFARNCPECSCELNYTNKNDLNTASKKGRLCKSCCKKGERNSFYGKKHTSESIEKRIKTLSTSDSWKSYLEYKKTEEYQKSIRDKISGENNGRFGKGSLKDIWTNKYGIEEAEIRHKNWTDKLSVAFSGENNHMYGKPSPVGSGNGWSGWYNGWYFRSLRELSYMITEIEDKNLSWENGEQNKYKIPYIDWDGKERNYFPDFVVENKYMIECKPFNLQNSKSVLAKKEFATEFCSNNKLEYIIVEPEIISIEKIKKLYFAEKIKFTSKYESKFLEYIKKK